MIQPADLVAENIEAAHRIGKRLIQAQERLSEVLPLESTPGNLDPDTVAWIDAFLKRWENFQDVLEGQVVRGLIILEGETGRVQTRRDRSHFLEKLGLVDAADVWFEAGELRNRLAHSYPLSNPKQIQRINAAASSSGLLIDTFNRLLKYIKRKELAMVSPEITEL